MVARSHGRLRPRMTLHGVPETRQTWLAEQVDVTGSAEQLELEIESFSRPKATMVPGSKILEL